MNNGTPETTYYVYDAAGQRARKVTETQGGARKGERRYLGGYEIYREYTGSNVTLERETLHVLDDQRRIAIVETATTPAELPRIRFQLGNHLGSACLELDQGGTLITYEDYHPYGTTAFQASRSAAEVGLKRYRYTGKERDDETGFTYHGARYYAPWLGRWTASDPAGMTDGTNLYCSVADNPVCFRDPNGRQLHPDVLEGMRQDYERERMAASEAKEKSDWDAYRRDLVLQGNYDVNVEDNPELQALKDRRIEAERQATEEVAAEGWSEGGFGAAIGNVARLKGQGLNPTAKDAAALVKSVAVGAPGRKGGAPHVPAPQAMAAGTTTAKKPGLPAPPKPKAPTTKPAAGAPGGTAKAQGAGRNVTISGTLTEAQFKESMKTEPGQYVYVIVDAHGNELKPGVTGDPYGRFNDYVTKEGMGTAQMRVYPAHPAYQARGSETAAIASHVDRGSATMNDRMETRGEMRQGGEWTESLYQPEAPSGPPLITIRR